jgi:DNA-binding transcriptional ArsR family regulator
VDRVFAALGDPIRRGILEILSTGEHSAGTVLAVLRERAPISQPAVSQHLKVLREAGLVSMEADGNRRLYRLDAGVVESARGWLHQLVEPMAGLGQPLDALATEIARGRRDRRRPSDVPTASPAAPRRAG